MTFRLWWGLTSPNLTQSTMTGFEDILQTSSRDIEVSEAIFGWNLNLSANITPLTWLNYARGTVEAGVYYLTKQEIKSIPRPIVMAGCKRWWSCFFFSRKDILLLLQQSMLCPSIYWITIGIGEVRVNKMSNPLQKSDAAHNSTIVDTCIFCTIV